VWTARSVREWYPSLRKPSWNPPRQVFAPVWTVLYILMGLAAALVWTAAPAGPWSVAFAVQLVLNVFWSYLFFGRRRPDAAALEIVALWISVLVSTLAMGALVPLAGALMAPYLVWVTFAGALNVAIVKLNPRSPL